MVGWLVGEWLGGWVVSGCWLRVVALSDPGRLSARATKLPTQVETSGWSVGGVVVHTKPDDGWVHTGARETQGVRARGSVTVQPYPSGVW